MTSEFTLPLSCIRGRRRLRSIFLFSSKCFLTGEQWLRKSISMSTPIYVISFLVLCVSIMCYYWQLQGRWDLENELQIAKSECLSGMHKEVSTTTGSGYNPFIMSTIYAHCFFSETYMEARKRFLELADLVATEQVSFPIYNNGSLHLTTDIAVISGKKDVVLLHMSGTHGVEAFAGSASQLALLTLLEKERKRLGLCVFF